MRSSIRVATRRATRHVLPDRGPTLRDVCSVIGAYVRVAEAYNKKWDPPSRFKTLCTPEESFRRMQEDIHRAYPAQPPVACKPESRSVSPPVSSKPALAPIAPAPPAPPPASGQPLPAGGVSPAPVVQREEQRDVIQVPLVFLPNGLLALDWAAVRAPRKP